MSKGNFLIQLDNSKVKQSIQISKSGVEDVSQNIYDQVLSGKVSAIDAAEMLKFVSEVAENVKSKADINGNNKFVDLVRDEIKASAEDGIKTTSKYGTILELAETGVKYDFTSCGDPVWGYLEEEIKKLDKLKKNREKFLKTISKSFPIGNVLNDITGELYEDVTLHPPVKTSTSSFKQSLLDD